MFYCISFTVAVFEFPHMLRILGLPSRARTPCSWCAVFGHFFYPRRATAHEGRGGMGDDCNCLRYTYSYILYALYMIHDNGFYYINCKCFGVSEFITFHVYLVLIRRINSRARSVRSISDIIKPFDVHVHDVWVYLAPSARECRVDICLMASCSQLCKAGS
jgi:hypothetical protein